MITPDPISQKISSSKTNSEKEKSERPSGRVDPEGFRKVFEVEEQKEPQGAIIDEEELDKKKAGEKKFGDKDKRKVDSDSEEKKSIFDMAGSKESPVKKEIPAAFFDPRIVVLQKEEGVTPSLEKAAVPTSFISERVAKIEKLQEIIDKITQEILHLENEKRGEQVVLIQLKEDGIFKGASIRISEFDSAKQQLNITIDNLTIPAKELMERNGQKLIERLSEMGYQVPNLSVTTAKVNERLILSEAPPSRSRDDKKDQDSSGQKEKKKR